MAIKETRFKTDGNSEVISEKNLYVGRVISVAHFRALRNHSDTLDYTDFCETNVTEALVYNGRRANGDVWYACKLVKSGEEIPLEYRFSKIDCTNLFVWRGSPKYEPEADAFLIPNQELLDDYAAWLKFKDEEVLAHDKEIEAQFAADRENARKRQASKKRVKKAPKIGTKVCVTEGPHKGRTGTVAWVSPRGISLVKNDAQWKDRQADGVWVGPAWLKTR